MQHIGPKICLLEKGHKRLKFSTKNSKNSKNYKQREREKSERERERERETTGCILYILWND